MTPADSDTLEKLRTGKLAGSVRLDLRGGLTEFPPEIYELADTLEILDLSGNRLSDLPDDLPRLHKLRILFCSDNDFRHVPDVLGACPSLEMIGFKENRIEAFDEPAVPEKLRWLVLTDNRLEKLPRSLGGCGRLQKLMLAGNRLEELPDEMADCVNLELVRLAANRFQQFPDWLFRLPRLAWLAVGGNPWCAPSGGGELPVAGWQELAVSETLGQGASGVIHAAAWKERPVAVKIFKGGMTSDGLPESEMRASLAAGGHPHLIRTLAEVVDHPEGRQALVMERIGDGYSNLAGPPSLESCTRDIYQNDVSLDLKTVLKTARALAGVAEHLHARRIAHGDLYAHNILRHADGHCLLGDFGAASVYPESAPFERIEVRAFGCLLEELLERSQPAGPDAVELREIRDACLHPATEGRPSFAEISRRLAGMEPGD